MPRIFLFIALFALNVPALLAQTATCIERELIDPDGPDPIVVRTCLFKAFKFEAAAYTDYAGRRIWRDHEVHQKIRGTYRKITNAQAFNARRTELVERINERIQADFQFLKLDSATSECLSGLDSIPLYGLDDLQLSFYNDEIWFSVRWGLNSGCRSVDGTIVSFTIDEIRRYMN
jgi:hypothetical protein